VRYFAPLTFLASKGVELWLLGSQLLKLGISAMVAGLVYQPLGVSEMLLKPRFHLLFWQAQSLPCAFFFGLIDLRTAS